MTDLESFAQRVQRLRVARGLSERELAERIGMTVHQYESLTVAGMSPTCSLVVDLADALDVSITDLTERTIETAPRPSELRAFLQELRWRRARTIGEQHQLSTMDRQLARLHEALENDAEPSADALDASAALMTAIERNEPIRTVASRYARLVLQRCAGKKGVAGRVLGIQHQTLGKYLRYPVDDDGPTRQTVDYTVSNGQIGHPLEEEVEATARAS
jgi:transcriptional regulator with XRE-family HTH domain